jgi:hypothetical protein
VASEIQKHLEQCADCHLVMDAAINTLDRYFSHQPPVEAPAVTRAA